MLSATSFTAREGFLWLRESTFFNVLPDKFCAAIGLRKFLETTIQESATLLLKKTPLPQPAQPIISELSIVPLVIDDMNRDGQKKLQLKSPTAVEAQPESLRDVATDPSLAYPQNRISTQYRYAETYGTSRNSSLKTERGHCIPWLWTRRPSDWWNHSKKQNKWGCVVWSVDSRRNCVFNEHEYFACPNGIQQSRQECYRRQCVIYQYNQW